MITSDPTFNQIDTASLGTYAYAGSPYYTLFLVALVGVLCCIFAKQIKAIIKIAVPPLVMTLLGFALLSQNDAAVKAVEDVPLMILFPICWFAAGFIVLFFKSCVAPKQVMRENDSIEFDYSLHRRARR